MRASLLPSLSTLPTKYLFVKPLDIYLFIMYLDVEIPAGPEPPQVGAAAGGRAGPRKDRPMLPSLGSLLFRALLVVVGLLTVLIGVNVGFGGILTLGLQGQVNFLEVTNEHAYLIRDSHIRYFGGLYGGVGLFLILAATDPIRYRSALNL